MNLGYVFEHGDSVLITTFVLLMTMSVVSWYIILWKTWSWRDEKSAMARSKPTFMGALDSVHSISLSSLNGNLRTLCSEWLNVQQELGAYDKEQSHRIVELHLTQALDRIRTHMDKGLTLLASIGSSAPFIGLFGTVWGIYGALTDIATAGNASLNVVAGPMGEALVATAIGLFAAIPAVLAYNSFVRTNRLLIQDYRHIAERLTLFSSFQRDSKPNQSNDSLKLVSGE